MSTPPNKTLRAQLIRLAHDNPAIRGEILPLITASQDVTAGSYQDYVERKKKEGKPPLKKDEWEARTNGGTQGGKTPSKKEPEKDEKPDKTDKAKTKNESPTWVDKKLGDLLGQWHSSGSDPLYAVSSNAQSGKAIPQHVAEAAIAKLDKMIAEESGADAKELTKAKKLLEKSVKDSSQHDKAPAKSYKKSYKPAVTKVMDKHSLTDDDAAQVKAFKSDKPPSGAPVSPAVLMQRFMAKAKPETKERMKGMSPKEFMAMLAAISDDEGGKTASLRSRLIRLAHDNHAIRGDILPLLRACDEGRGVVAAGSNAIRKFTDAKLEKEISFAEGFDHKDPEAKQWLEDLLAEKTRRDKSKKACDSEGPMMGKYEEGKPADPTENMSEEDKKTWELNTLRHKDKFKQAGDPKAEVLAAMVKVFGEVERKFGKDAVKAAFEGSEDGQIKSKWVKGNFTDLKTLHSIIVHTVGDAASDNKVPYSTTEPMSQFQRGDGGHTLGMNSLEMSQAAAKWFWDLKDAPKFSMGRAVLVDAAKRYGIALDRKKTIQGSDKTAKHPLDRARGHVLAPASVMGKLPPIGSTENTDDPIVYVKFFSPYGNGAATWYLTEYDPSTKEAFGWADLGMGGGELGYIDVEELEGMQKRGLPLIERDTSWRPVPLSKAKAGRMASTNLRSQLIRLAHDNPAIRGDLLPLLKEAGVSKVAGRAVVRKMIAISVNVLQHKVLPFGDIEIYGQMSLDFGGDETPESIRFAATLQIVKDAFVVKEFIPVKSINGAGAGILLGVLRSALTEALVLKGGALVMPVGEVLTIPAR